MLCRCRWRWIPATVSLSILCTKNKSMWGDVSIKWNLLHVVHFITTLVIILIPITNIYILRKWTLIIYHICTVKRESKSRMALEWDWAAGGWSFPNSIRISRETPITFRPSNSIGQLKWRLKIVFTSSRNRQDNARPHEHI